MAIKACCSGVQGT